MGDLINFKKLNRTISTQELIEMGKTALKERDRLLEEHPELREFQNEIDRRLDNAGSSENRMAVLAIMMEAKLKDLRDELSQLSTLMQQYSIPSNVPDE
jgi:hypothetical protein